MHGKNVEFGNLIPGKLSFWKEIFAILRGNLSFRWYFCLFLTHFSENMQTINIFDANFDFYSREILHFFQPSTWVYFMVQYQMAICFTRCFSARAKANTLHICHCQHASQISYAHESWTFAFYHVTHIHADPRAVKENIIFAHQIRPTKFNLSYTEPVTSELSIGFDNGMTVYMLQTAWYILRN